MFRPRIIPCLLLKNKGLVKTINFENPRYIGDPINAVRIFNEKEADELIFLDITGSRKLRNGQNEQNNKICFELVAKISKECLMPLTYGGGITNVNEIETLFQIGVEKVSLNSYAVLHPEIIHEASHLFGNQSIIVSIDVKKHLNGNYEVYLDGGNTPTGKEPSEFAHVAEVNGAGEIMINSIDRDGTMEGYDLSLIRTVADSVEIPVIACGGARDLPDFVKAFYDGHASALAAGSLFVYHGRKRAVLINYPTKNELENLFNK